MPLMDSVMHHTPLALILLLIGGLLLGTPALGETVFEDTFEDDRPLANDGVSTWTQRGGGSDALQESDSRITLTATGEGYVNTHIMTQSLEELDFFQRPLVIRVEGFELTGEGGEDKGRTFRMSLVPKSQPAFEAETGVMLRLNAVGYLSFGYKIDQTKIDPTSVHSLLGTKLKQAPSAIELSLDAEGYTITTQLPDGNTETFAGRYTDEGPGLTAADWGAKASALVLQSQKAPGQPTDSVTVIIDRISVSVQTEPH